MVTFGYKNVWPTLMCIFAIIKMKPIDVLGRCAILIEMPLLLSENKIIYVFEMDLSNGDFSLFFRFRFRLPFAFFQKLFCNYELKLLFLGHRTMELTECPHTM